MTKRIDLNRARSSQIVDILQLILLYEDVEFRETREFKDRFASLEIFISNTYDHLGEFKNYLNTSEHLRENASNILEWYLAGDSGDFRHPKIDDELLKPMSIRVEYRAIILLNSLHKEVRHFAMVFKRIRLSAAQKTRALRVIRSSMIWESNQAVNNIFSKLKYISLILENGQLPLKALSPKAIELLSSIDPIFIPPETQARDVLDWYIERSPKGVYQGVTDAALKSGELTDSDIIRISKIPEFYYEEKRQEAPVPNQEPTDIWSCQESSNVRLKRLKVVGNVFYRPVFTASGQGLIEEWTMILADIDHNVFSMGVNPRATVKEFGWKSFTFNDTIGDLFSCKGDAQSILLARMKRNLAEVENSMAAKGNP